MEVFYLEASIIIEMYVIFAEALHPMIPELLAFDATVYVEVASDLHDEGLNLAAAAAAAAAASAAPCLRRPSRKFGRRISLFRSVTFYWYCFITCFLL